MEQPKSVKKTTIIHCIRHGVVENPQGIRYGRLPGIHLSELGRRHIQSLDSFFLNRRVAVIYCSPLERTQQTATLLGLVFPQTPIVLDERLQEVKLSSSYEGKSKEIHFAYPRNPSSSTEAAQGVYQRMASFMEEKTITHAGLEIVAISHADPIALITNRSLFGETETLRDPYPNYGSITSFVYSGLDLGEAWYFDSLPDFIQSQTVRR